MNSANHTGRQTDGLVAADADEREAHYAQHDMSEDELSTTVIQALSEAAGVDPLEFDTPLNDYVDPDALNSLFRTRPDGTARPGGSLTFRIEGYDVTVRSTGQIEITPV